jgi:hypothetical protein
MSTGRTFPTGVGAPILLEGLQVIGRVRPLSVIHRSQALLDDIRAALLAKFGTIPVLATYRQMAIRQQKIKDWPRAIWWVERGLALYGDRAARPEAVEDLRKRLVAYRAKLTAPPKSAPAWRRRRSIPRPA